MAGVAALKFALHLPASLAVLDSKSRWMRVMKCCPACGSTLLTYHEKQGETQVGKTGTIGGGHKPSNPVKKNPVYDENILSWYCSRCGVHIVPEQTDESGRTKNKRLSNGDVPPPMVNNPTTPAVGKPPLAPRQVAHRRSEGGSRESLLENGPSKLKQQTGVLMRMNSYNRQSSLSTSPQSPTGSSIIDEPYLSFERGIQDGLTALLNHIRNHLMQKEGQLREYQFDMLHREKTLKANEQDFVVRFTRLEQSEKSLKHKRERLQMYKDTMMYQLEAKAKQLAKFENKMQWNHQISDVEQSTQNDSSGMSNNSSSNPALPPKQSREVASSTNRTASILENDTQRQHVTYQQQQQQQPRPISNALINDGRTSYHPNHHRYSNTHTFRLSFTAPSSGSSQQNSLTSGADPKWRRSDPQPIRVVTTTASTASSLPVQHSKKIQPVENGVKDPENEQTGVLHVDTGYYSVRQGEQKRSSSYGNQSSTSTPSLLQVDDERWRHQQGSEDPSNKAQNSQIISHQNSHQNSQVISHEQLDKRYYPGYESRRSFDIAEPPMKESPRQAWMRSRQRIENAQQQLNNNNHIKPQKPQQHHLYQKQLVPVYKPSVQIERQHQQLQKSWSSSPNINQVNSSYDELPESHRMNSSHDNLLDPEIPRASSRDSLIERNLSTTDVQVASPSSPPPAYNGAGPPLPKLSYQNHYQQQHQQLQHNQPQYTQVVINGYSPHGSNDEASRYEYYYHSRDPRHYSPGSRVYVDEQVAPRHMRRVTEL